MDATLSEFESFTSWYDVLGAADRGERLWYHAPLDRYPVPIAVDRIFKNGKIRISAEGGDFTADAGHLDRFRRKAR